MLVARQTNGNRGQGGIRKRGNSLQVSVYAGVDPLTGKRVYLSASTTDRAEAQRILNRFRSEVDEQRHARTKGTLRAAFQDWLKVHEVEASTRRGYEDYLRLYVGPALGDQPIGKITARVLEQFYAELRRCSVRCDGKPYVDPAHAEVARTTTTEKHVSPGQPGDTSSPQP